MNRTMTGVKLCYKLQDDRLHETEAYIVHYKKGDAIPFLPDPKEVQYTKISKWIDKKEHEYKYYHIYCGFDIETTNVLDDPDNKMAFMYHWQFSFCFLNGGYVFLGRKWEDLEELWKKITTFYKCGNEYKLLVWDANLGFEHSFIAKRFNFDSDNFFAKEERHPLSAPIVNGIDLREALTISGGSLAQLAKDYTYTQKLKGDLDYSVRRSYLTPLAPETEEMYCINDVLILSEWSYFIFHKYIIPINKIPLTKTGLLRAEVKDELNALLDKEQLKAYKTLVYNAFPDANTYEYWFKYLFRGGYVHSNIVNTGITLKDVDGYDITSSYPAQMNIGYYPMTPFRALYEFDIDEVIDKYCCIITAEFYGLKRKTSISYESLHKTIDISKKTIISAFGKPKEVIDGLIDNGRIAEAKYVKVCLTELDYKIYKQLYTWDDCKIRCLYVSDRGRLPKFILNVLNRHYKKKAALKKAGLSETVEYAITKALVNAAYGLMVTRLNLNKVVFKDGEWSIEEDAIDYDKERKKQILLPQWGIWVCAQARFSLMMPMFEIIKKYGASVIVYNDTDSNKVIDKDGGIAKIFEKYNKWVYKRVLAAGLTDEEFNDLGQYEHEGNMKKYKHTYTRFKTLGAKRYLSEGYDKKGVFGVHATISGLPKAAVHNIKGDPFEEFNEYGMTLSFEVSLKNTVSYIDHPTEFLFEDGALMQEITSAVIYPITFSMNLDDVYKKMVQNTIEKMKKEKRYGD